MLERAPHPLAGRPDGAPGEQPRPPWTQARALERVGPGPGALAPTMEPTGLRLWDPDTSSGKPTGDAQAGERIWRGSCGLSRWLLQESRRPPRS